MAEYIEREAAVAFLENMAASRYLIQCFESKERFPAADVVEVRHGEWLPDYETFVDEWERESEPIQTGWVCSLCGRQEFAKEPYCNCGAKMDGKGEGE